MCTQEMHDISKRTLEHMQFVPNSPSAFAVGRRSHRLQFAAPWRDLPDNQGPYTILSSPYFRLAGNAVERFVNRSKRSRLAATSCNELAADHLALVRLTSVRSWPAARQIESRPSIGTAVRKARRRAAPAPARTMD